MILSTVAAFIALTLAAPTAGAQAPTVIVKNGSYAGVHSGPYNQDFFLGIPFSQPPIGQLRLALPQSLNETWTGLHNATAYGPGCIGFAVSKILIAIGKGRLTEVLLGC
jgi:hypothetical protein